MVGPEGAQTHQTSESKSNVNVHDSKIRKKKDRTNKTCLQEVSKHKCLKKLPDFLDVA